MERNPTLVEVMVVKALTQDAGELCICYTSTNETQGRCAYRTDNLVVEKDGCMRPESCPIRINRTLGALLDL